jgi:hypothetical protein
VTRTTSTLSISKTAQQAIGTGPPQQQLLAISPHGLELCEPRLPVPKVRLTSLQSCHLWAMLHVFARAKGQEKRVQTARAGTGGTSLMLKKDRLGAQDMISSRVYERQRVLVVSALII